MKFHLSCCGCGCGCCGCGGGCGCCGCGGRKRRSLQTLKNQLAYKTQKESQEAPEVAVAGPIEIESTNKPTEQVNFKRKKYNPKIFTILGHGYCTEINCWGKHAGQTTVEKNNYLWANKLFWMKGPYCDYKIKSTNLLLWISIRRSRFNAFNG